MGILSWLGIGRKEGVEAHDATQPKKAELPYGGGAAGEIQNRVRGKIGNVAAEKQNPYGEKAGELNKRQGGIANRLEKLLRVHKEGKSIDVPEYEGLLRYTFENGTWTIENKIYHLVAGVAEGLMTLSQLAELSSYYVSDYPWLEFFMDKTMAKPINKDTNQELPRAFTAGELYMMYRFFQENHPRNVKNFLWQKILPHPAVEARAAKGPPPPRSWEKKRA